VKPFHDNAEEYADSLVNARNYNGRANVYDQQVESEDRERRRFDEISAIPSDPAIAFDGDEPPPETDDYVLRQEQHRMDRIRRYRPHNV
jgi:hypothetical protein